MTTETLTLYHGVSSPNSRRVRVFLAEKGLTVPLVAVDLGKGEQHGDAYRAINPRRVVPTLVLADGTSIGEVPVIQRYIEEIYPDAPLLGTSAKDRALIAMWDRRVEQEGFASVMEAIRNLAAGLKGRAIAGPHDYAQIPELVERSRQRTINFLADLDERLRETAFVAGDRFSVADITALVTIDFAAKAIDLPVPTALQSVKRWYDGVSVRASASA
ncbi:glutathione S-transferase family protein [Paraburkholderia bryophila]|uniref:Glutathione S-transferase n=1 Tax=Paraburkholderia bryophila TaxID=420952 RepID=A0A7Y9WWW9_9BURK|nr:glutathione S-transferase [Paraburkholderia bryophila]NYH16831.1 glutathione S-transferase [Paraburkholderia bryophila]NYH27855.1 glutathione S-transferase [Paraburkholderia bryophila]